MEEQEEVKEILDRPVRMVDMHRPDRGLSIPRLPQALMQGQRFIERRDDQESHRLQRVWKENSSVAFRSKTPLNSHRTTRDAILYYGLE